MHIQLIIILNTNIEIRMEYPDGDKQIQISNAQIIEEYPATSCRESPGKDLIDLIRSLTPQPR
jgi:hypothetical protein